MIRRRWRSIWSGTSNRRVMTWPTGPKPADIVIALRERAQTLKDMAEKSAVWFGPLTRVRRRRRGQAPEGRGTRAAGRCARAAGGVAPRGPPEAIGEVFKATAEAQGLGMGKIAQPMRVAITGTQVSPDIGHTVYLCGRDEATGADRRRAGKNFEALQARCRCKTLGSRRMAQVASPAAAPDQHHVHDAAGFVSAVERACSERGLRLTDDPRARARAGRRCRQADQGLRPARQGARWRGCRRRRAADGVSRAGLPAGQRFHPQAGIGQRLRRLPPSECRAAFGAVPDLRRLPQGDRTGRRTASSPPWTRRRAGWASARRRRPWKCTACARSAQANENACPRREAGADRPQGWAAIRRTGARPAPRCDPAAAPRP